MRTHEFGLWAAMILAVAVLIILWQHAQGTQAIINAVSSGNVTPSGSIGTASNVVALYPQINAASNGGTAYVNQWAARAASAPAIGYPA